MIVEPDSTTVRVGRHIGRALYHLRMPQYELANKLGVDPTTVGLYVRGRINIGVNQLAAIADIFGMSPEQLLTGDHPWLRDDEAERAAV